MASKKKSTDGQKKTQLSARQKQIRRQQVFMAVVGIILILTMVLALVMKY